MATIPFQIRTTTSPKPIRAPSSRTHLFPRSPSRPATWRSSSHTPLRALKHESKQQVKSRRKAKNRKAGGGGRQRSRHVEEYDDVEEDEDDVDADVAAGPMPNPPAGFVLDPDGKVLLASSRRLVTIVDPKNNLPLECVIRRIFTSSQGKECMLLCPVDMAVLILRSTNFSGWNLIDDKETEAVLPAASYALAKIHIHLVNTGFCFTARGGFCYSDEDIMEFSSDDDEDPAEGVEIANFNLDGSHYMIYTPVDPLLFIAAKDSNGTLEIADDDLLDDPAVKEAIDEETQFNAFVDEELALQESLTGDKE
ncbi:hypothetical protein LUZ60_015973 [Juncus effusus]|nr:hypothetical protein LUZ60_015973 [Juncus effusus]